MADQWPLGLYEVHPSSGALVDVLGTGLKSRVTSLVAEPLLEGTKVAS